MLVLYSKDNDFYDNNKDALLKMGIAFSFSNSISVILSQLTKDKNSVVFYDFENPNASVEVAEDLLNANVINIKSMIFITDQDVMRKKLNRLGFDCVSKKHILTDIQTILPNLEIKRDLSNNIINLELKNRVYEELFAMGLSPKFVGFYYLVDLIILCSYEIWQLGSLVKSAYSFVAKKNNTTASCVERSIRSVKSFANIELNNKELILDIIEKTKY